MVETAAAPPLIPVKELVMITKTQGVCSSCLLAFLLSAVPVQAADNIGDAIAGGEFGFNLRYRFEFVDQDGFSQDANASTLRTRLNYKTAIWNKWSFFIEADNVTELIFDDFNSGSGTSSADRSIYPVVADPNGTEINQAWINYAFTDKAGFKLGRQRILLDNQRFVGGVGWRQNEQTYDAISISAKSGGKGNFFYAFVDNVNRIFGDDVAAGDHEQDTHLVNFTWPVAEKLKLGLYYYAIDNKDLASFSTQTAGLRLSGKHTLSESKFNWGLEWADQSDNANNTVDYSANYLRLDAGLALEKVSLSAGYEVLEGDDSRAGASFRTPLATLHAFNGWADQFLGTPNDGLEDFFLGIAGKTAGYGWKLVWHDFAAESGGRDFGQELDASVSRKLTDRLGLLLKGAFFDADSPSFRDTTKVWLMLTANF